MYTFLIQATAYQNEVLHERYNYLQSLVKMIDVRLGGNDLQLQIRLSLIIWNISKQVLSGQFLN